MQSRNGGIYFWKWRKKRGWKKKNRGRGRKKNEGRGKFLISEILISKIKAVEIRA